MFIDRPLAEHARTVPGRLFFTDRRRIFSALSDPAVIQSSRIHTCVLLLQYSLIGGGSNEMSDRRILKRRREKKTTPIQIVSETREKTEKASVFVALFSFRVNYTDF